MKGTLLLTTAVILLAGSATAGTGAPGRDDRWLYFDNGSRGGDWTWQNLYQGVGVKFGVSLRSRVDNVRFYNNVTGSSRYRLVVYDDDGAGGTPGTSLVDTICRATVQNWITVGLTGWNVMVDAGGFYVFIYNDSTTFINTRPRMSYDNNGQTAPNPNWLDASYYSHAFTQPTSPNGDWLIRAFVSDTAVYTTDADVRWIYPSKTATFDSFFSNIQPACTVQNHGAAADTFNVRMRIGSFYDTVVTVTNLAAGAQRYVTFPYFRDWPAGAWAVRCSAECPGDEQPLNDTANSDIFCRVLNARADSITLPAVIDSGTTVVPRAGVSNLSSIQLQISTKFDIIGTGYTSTVSSPYLDPGQGTAFNFGNWVPGTQQRRGTYEVRCSTRLGNDFDQSDNRVLGSVRVRVWDVGPTAILAPIGVVDSGTKLRPQVLVRNDGTDTTSFDVRLNVGAGYSNTRAVTSLAPFDQRLVYFDTWAAPSRGQFSVRCTTILATDRVRTNDTLSSSVTVRVLDAAAIALLGPSGTFDSGDVATPRAIVANPGSSAATFYARFTIGSYRESLLVSGLASGAQETLDFPLWTARGRGTVAVRCTTMLDGDVVGSNDWLGDSVRLRVHDVTARQVLSPVGHYTPGPINPLALVANRGTQRESCRVFFDISSGSSVYLESLDFFDGLPVGTDTTVAYPTWTAAAGSYTATCYVVMANDQVGANDTARQVFTVGDVDVGATAIIAPIGNIDTTADVTPSATVRNFGSQPADFSATFRITSGGSEVYSSLRNVTGLASGESETLYFDLLPKPHVEGDYAVSCSTSMVGDGNPGNDVVTGAFSFVTAPPPTPWTARSAMPLTPSGKPNKDGGWLSWDVATARFYAAKGNKTPDFYTYDVAADSWQGLAPMPDGAEMKKPGKGSAGTAAGGAIYATKGNNTQGFYRYDAIGDSWQALASVPLGTTNKRVKAGCGIAYVDRGTEQYVYLLKGQKTEFWRYDIANDSWASMPDAPLGTSAKVKYDNGSFLAYDGTGTIYCHKSKYNELFAYDVALDTWLPQLAGMPFASALGTQKKSKDGAGGAFVDGSLYALKGGNTQEFWQYAPADDSWTELDPMPLIGASGKKKKVKAGAGLAGFYDGHKSLLYGLKGNKTLEFWMYVPTTYAACSPRHAREGVLASDVVRGASWVMRISPNPLASGAAVLSYALPGPGSALVTVSDVTGRTVLARTVAARRRGSIRLDLSELSAGAYLVRLTAGGFTASQKLVVNH